MHDRPDRSAYFRAYYEANKDKVLERQRAYYEANKDVIQERKRAYYEANKDKVLERQRSFAARGLTRAERVAEIQRKYAGEGGIV